MPFRIMDKCGLWRSPGDRPTDPLVGHAHDQERHCAARPLDSGVEIAELESGYKGGELQCGRLGTCVGGKEAFHPRRPRGPEPLRRTPILEGRLRIVGTLVNG